MKISSLAFAASLIATPLWAGGDELDIFDALIAKEEAVKAAAAARDTASHDEIISATYRLEHAARSDAPRSLRRKMPDPAGYRPKLAPAPRPAALHPSAGAASGRAHKTPSDPHILHLLGKLDGRAAMMVGSRAPGTGPLWLFDAYTNAETCETDTATQARMPDSLSGQIACHEVRELLSMSEAGEDLRLANRISIPLGAFASAKSPKAGS